MDEREQPQRPHSELNQEQQRRQVPRSTHNLALQLAEGMIALANVANNAPPPQRRILEDVLDVMYDAATHVYATIGEGNECALRIAQRQRAIKERMTAQAQREHDRMTGDLLSQFFRDPGAARMIFPDLGDIPFEARGG